MIISTGNPKKDLSVKFYPEANVNQSLLIIIQYCTAAKEYYNLLKTALQVLYSKDHTISEA